MPTITGRLLGAETQNPVAKLRVQAVSVEPREPPVLGEGTSDIEGAFAIRIPAIRTDVAFHVFRGRTLLVDTTGTVVWNPRTHPAPGVIEVPEVPPRPAPGGAAPGPAAAASERHQLRPAMQRLDLLQRRRTGARRLPRRGRSQRRLRRSYELHRPLLTWRWLAMCKMGVHDLSTAQR
jgi:hypothetical protein